MLTYQQIETISRTGSKMNGRYEVRTLGLVMGRYATEKMAIAFGHKLQASVESRVGVFAVTSCPSPRR